MTTSCVILGLLKRMMTSAGGKTVGEGPAGESAGADRHGANTAICKAACLDFTFCPCLRFASRFRCANSRLQGALLVVRDVTEGYDHPDGPEKSEAPFHIAAFAQGL